MERKYTEEIAKRLGMTSKDVLFYQSRTFNQAIEEFVAQDHIDEMREKGIYRTAKPSNGALERIRLIAEFSMGVPTKYSDYLKQYQDGENWVRVKNAEAYFRQRKTEEFEREMNRIDPESWKEVFL